MLGVYNKLGRTSCSHYNALLIAIQGKVRLFITLSYDSTLLKQAIEDEDLEKLEDAVKAMQEEGSVAGEECLNVVVNVPGPKRDPKKLLPMTLLAFAGYHAMMKMMRYLIEKHASKSQLSE